jgi:hypothetical protein
MGRRESGRVIEGAEVGMSAPGRRSASIHTKQSARSRLVDFSWRLFRRFFQVSQQVVAIFLFL